MRLFDAILMANQRAGDRSATVELPWQQYETALPVVVLSCIDPRLNRWIPNALGIPENHFIWLRNAGNIITGPLSSTTRSIALACLVKGGKEIAVLGHTDCQVGKTSMLQLTDAMKNRGVERARLPENLVEYFGLFASERQNVLKAVDLIRSSPLIGPTIPVHGLLMDTQSGRLEWLVNGYQTLETVASKFSSAIAKAERQPLADMMESIPEFKTGEVEMRSREIGSSATQVTPMFTAPVPAGEMNGAERQKEITSQPSASSPDSRQSQEEGLRSAGSGEADPAILAKAIDPNRWYRLIGDDNKVYGPVPGRTVQLWLMDNRIDAHTPIQEEGTEEWKKLGALAAVSKLPHPPPVPASTKFKKRS